MAESTSSQAHTYHCLCSTLILASKYQLSELPQRHEPVKDHALKLPMPYELLSANDARVSEADLSSTLHNVTPDRKAVMIRREDGFEKRRVMRCQRCQLALGYVLEDAHSQQSPLYLLPGGLVSTEDMMAGKPPEPAAWEKAD
jgi:hypothetical protein